MAGFSPEIEASPAERLRRLREVSSEDSPAAGRSSAVRLVAGLMEEVEIIEEELGDLGIRL